MFLPRQILPLKTVSKLQSDVGSLTRKCRSSPLPRLIMRGGRANMQVETPKFVLRLVRLLPFPQSTPTYRQGSRMNLFPLTWTSTLAPQYVGHRTTSCEQSASIRWEPPEKPATTGSFGQFHTISTHSTVFDMVFQWAKKVETLMYKEPCKMFVFNPLCCCDAKRITVICNNLLHTLLCMWASM